MPSLVNARPPASTSTTALQAAVDAVLDAALTEQRLVGAVVQIAVDGTVAYRRADGWSDREARLPMSHDTLFRLASVSKPVVSTAAMVRVAQGRLALDAPVQRWLPHFRPALADGSTPDITLRQLLSHTAGLGYRFLDEHDDGPHARAGVSDGMDAAPISLQDNVRRLASVPLQYRPGTGWGYSLAIDVVGALLECVDGAPLQHVVRDAVSGPLGMADTDFHALDPARLAAAYVSDSPVPHRLVEGETVSPFPGLIGICYSPARALDPQAFPSGGAGMVGSAADILRLLEALRQGTVPGLAAAWVAQMGRIQSGGFGPEPGYGFGMGFSVLQDPVQANTPQTPGTWRWGGAYGHSWFVDPARRLTVVALTNTLYEGMSGAFGGALRDAVYSGLQGVRA